MKKITLLAIVLMSSLGFAQQQQYNLGFEPGTPSGVASVWYTFDNGAAPAEIVTNPDPDGVNTSATTKVLKVVMGPGNAFYAGVNNKWQDKAFGTWKIDAAIPSNLTVTMDINKNYVGTVGLKMSTKNEGAQTFQITDQNVANAVVDQWQTITWTIPSIPATLETDVAQFVVFVDWTQGQPDRAANSTILIDNIRFNAEKLTDAPVPTCTDGIQNGDETGVDCGGTTCPVCILEPTVSAPVPTIPESEVLSVYSDSYLVNKVTGYVFQDFAGSGPNTQVDIQNNGNMSGKITNLSYYGSAFGTIDLSQETSPGVSKYDYVHLDYYATSSNEIKFYVIDPQVPCCGSPQEPRYTIKATGGDATLVKGQWQSVFIPLSFFKTYSGLGGAIWDGNPVTQIKFEGNGSLYYDNIYFSKNNSLATTSFETANISMYPNPANNVLNIDAKSNIENVSIYNLLGQIVISESVNKQSTSLNIANLQTGIYVVKTSIDGKIASSRLIKE